MLNTDALQIVFETLITFICRYSDKYTPSCQRLPIKLAHANGIQTATSIPDTFESGYLPQEDDSLYRSMAIKEQEGKVSRCDGAGRLRACGEMPTAIWQPTFMQGKQEGGTQWPFKSGKHQFLDSYFNHFFTDVRMEQSLVFVLLTILCCTSETIAGRHESRRISKLEDAVQYLIREVKDLKTARCRQERTSETLSSQKEMELAQDTLSALKAESRALSQFDQQLRNLQNSLIQLGNNKSRQIETVQAFRLELQTLREDVDDLKQSKKYSRAIRDTPSENAIKTLQWLVKTVNQLRADVSQINKNINLRQSSLLSEDTQKQISLIMGEIRELRHELTEERLERQRTAAEVTQTRMDFKDLSDSYRHFVGDLSALNSEISFLREDFNISTATGLKWEENISQNDGDHRFLNKVHELNAAVKSLHETQIELELKVNHLQDSSNMETVRSTENKLAEIATLYSKLESKVLENEVLLEKLKASHSGIHEHIKTFEDHNDWQTKEIQTVVDQIQYNLTRVYTQTEINTQHQEVINDKLSQISQSIDQTESEMEKDRISLLLLQNKAANETLIKCQEETKFQIQDLRIETLEYQILTFKLQIDIFNTTMENWNSALNLRINPSETKSVLKKNERTSKIDATMFTDSEDDSSEEFFIVDDCVVNC